MRKNKVIIYVKNTCIFCHHTKKLLIQKDIEFEEIDVLQHSDLFQQIKLQFHVNTVPQIFINNLHIGGYDQLLRITKEGALDKI
ncbi:glutaredoxin domain-containing protein [Wolbachia endosymbiont of Howardula sp.]|uniref:glutaredoxin domain-containing protein n=1 Tax=Wolbachia endosymbiont of Howardula sp. TaxID=2916816 RepID=UPI00217E720B|nr:glutaredoxin domain-containing protein [Wolbachia endosymbiont of Howardula sp.]UWI83347.1 glutaredoxin family protein [Wolbachia endosymbiont of Howardula sp.]